MLVLSRKRLESIRISDDIEIVLLDIGKNRVRLGFRCPPSVSITREELRSTGESARTGAAHTTEATKELACV